MRAAVLLLIGCTLPKSDSRPVEDGWQSIADTSAPMGPPALQVRPDAVDFGVVALGESAHASIELANVGGNNVVFDELRLANEEPGLELEWAAGDRLAPGASADLSLTWSPDRAQTLEGTVRIGSNDPVAPLIEVSLTGVTATPQIEVDPTSTDFGYVPIGHYTVQPISIKNVGHADLEIESVSFMPSDPSDLTMEPIETPFVVPWGERRVATIQFAPTDEGKDQAVLTVQSNDSNTPTVHAELHGTGVADADTGT